MLDGVFALDGGAMFGIVPKNVWERSDPPDRENRIALALRCLLIKIDSRIILVDTGAGERWSARDLERFGIDRSNGGLAGALALEGLSPEDITDVVLTHLHFDHAGGVKTSGGALAFPKARHYLQRRNLVHALHPTARDRGSYLPDKFDALLSSKQLTLLDGPGEIAAGVDVILFEGHTVAQQLVRVRDPSQRGAPWILYGADIIPTSAHLGAAFVMGYDLTPDVTAREKTRALNRAVESSSLIVFEHDPKLAAATIRFDDQQRPAIKDALISL